MPKISEHVISKRATGAERRRTKRVPLSFQIEVSGRDRTGAAFCERAMTSDVNQNGCKFDLLWELKPGDLVSISVSPKGPRLTPAEQPTIFQVVWVEPSELGWTVGATSLQNKNIWHMVFPVKK
jgi:hypothetical protein